MKLKKYSNSMLALAVATLLSAPYGTALAQSSDPAWLDELKFQIAQEHSCDVAFYVNVVERRVESVMTYSARVQCTDGRQFDAVKMSSEPVFTITTCGSQVCEAPVEGKPKS